MDIEAAVGQIKTILAEKLGAESAARKALEEKLAFIEQTLGQYTRQLPKLGTSNTGRDPSYKGFFDNEEQAKHFGLFAIAALHPHSQVRSDCAGKVAKFCAAIRTADGKFCSADTFVKAMGESTDSAGGYLVPEEFARAIIRNVEQYGVFRQRIAKVPMAGSRMSWPKRTGGFTVYYPDEGVAVTASQLAFGRVTLNAKKWGIFAEISRELEEDSAVGLGELLALEFTLALAIAEDTNGFVGDGTSTYAGITGVLGSSNVSVVTMGSGDTDFEDLDSDDLIDLKAAVPTYAKRAPDCAYYAHPEICAIIEKMKDGMGRPIYQQPTEDRPARVHGYELVEVNTLPDSGDTAISTKFIAFGSLMLWGMLGQRRAISVERSKDTLFKEDQIAVKCIVRQDIQEADGDAMAVLRTAAA